MKSMTFAKTDQYLDKCDCDECDNVPPSIREIIHLRREERRASGPIKRTQQRSLVNRDGQISIWCMTMPQNAEPLIEFGSSHRIVWVKKLTGTTSSTDSGQTRSTLNWIGNGIVGSSDEEKSRKKMTEWTDGKFFLVPSNGGKAIGWIHTSGSDSASTHVQNEQDDDTNETKSTEDRQSESYNNAVLYVAKIPLYLVDKEKRTSGESSNKSWTNQVIERCRNGLESYQNGSENVPSYYKFSDKESKLLKIAFCNAEGVGTKDDDEIEPPNKKARLDHQQST